MTTTTTKLKNTLTTYWGDQFNGLWVTWTHDSTASGSKSMGIRLQANLYSAAKEYYLFGQTFNPSTADTAVTTNNGIKPSTNWDYCLSTQPNDATLDANCPPYYTRDGAGAILTTNKVWDKKKYLKLVVIWANPDATCPTICYDGVAALV